MNDVLQHAANAMTMRIGTVCHLSYARHPAGRHATLSARCVVNGKTHAAQLLITEQVGPQGLGAKARQLADLLEDKIRREVCFR